MDINALLKTSGINIKEFLYSLKGVPSFVKNYNAFTALARQSKGEFPVKSFNPSLADRFEKAGTISQHYFYQDLIVANRIFLNNPSLHVDVGSRIDGFVAHLASFRKVEVFDIRDLTKPVPNVKFVKADLMNSNFEFTDYCDSVSCLHAIEHFGLGRYGDPLDYYGHIKGLDNIYKLLKKNGTFYFSSPIGPQRIEFDAHRVFSVKYLLDIFKDRYELKSFSYIDDKENYYLNHQLSKKDINNNCGCNFGCGIFELVKL